LAQDSPFQGRERELQLSASLCSLFVVPWAYLISLLNYMSHGPLFCRPSQINPYIVPRVVLFLFPRERHQSAINCANRKCAFQYFSFSFLFKLFGSLCARFRLSGGRAREKGKGIHSRRGGSCELRNIIYPGQFAFLRSFKKATTRTLKTSLWRPLSSQLLLLVLITAEHISREQQLCHFLFRSLG
jgi:hypothetical protein